MKILVCQIKISKNNLYSYKTNISTEDFYSFEEKVCIPSVQSWAKKCGYDYKLYTESSLENYDYFQTKGHSYSAEKLIRLLEGDYDYKIFVDSDVYVNPKAENFPINSGLSVLSENVFLITSIYTNYTFEKEKNKSYNTGVFGIDRATSKLLYEHFVDELENGSGKNYSNSEQDIMNLWIVKNNIEVHELNKKWNLLLFENDITKIDLSQINFFHFAHDAKVNFKYFYRNIHKSLSKK